MDLIKRSKYITDRIFWFFFEWESFTFHKQKKIVVVVEVVIGVVVVVVVVIPVVDPRNQTLKFG